MGINNIPEKIKLFNVYKDSDKLIGVSGEITLPDFEAVTETFSMAGILGEFESPTQGLFGSMEMEIPFVSLNESIFAILDSDGYANLTVRGSQIVSDAGTGKIAERPIRVVVRGLSKGITTGKLKAGSPMESSIKLEVLYIKIEIGGKEMLELDKLNTVYKVNGKDYLTATRKNI